MADREGKPAMNCLILTYCCNEVTLGRILARPRILRPDSDKESAYPMLTGGYCEGAPKDSQAAGSISHGEDPVVILRCAPVRIGSTGVGLGCTRRLGQMGALAPAGAEW